MASLSRWLVAGLLATTASGTPLGPDTNAPPKRAPAAPAGLQADSPLDPAFKRSDKPTPPPVGFPGLPPRPTRTTTIRSTSFDIPSDIIVGDSSERGQCTHTVTPEKLKDWPCPTGGTLSVYRTWTMETRKVDCRGCGEVYIPASTYHCPINEIKTTEWVPTPTTYTTFVCAPTKAAELEAAVEKRQGITFSGPGGVVEFSCPTTYVIQPEQTAGVIWTEYKAWSTKTVGLQCSGCPLVTSTAKLGLGPAGRFKTTTTLPMGTTTAYKCQ